MRRGEGHRAEGRIFAFAASMLHACMTPHASEQILKHPHAAGCRLFTRLFFQPVQYRRIVEIFWRSFGRLGADGR